jgi:type IX secretion system PorP/SprF family membrane protein
MRHILINIFLFLSVLSYGQDPHMSQYFSSPLLLNPALTANFDGDFRFAGSYRQQWWQNGFPYNTYISSFETRLLKSKLPDYSRLGVGLNLMGDQSLAGVVKTVGSMMSVAYHQPLDENGFNSLGAGIQFMYANKKINYNSLNFESQFDGNGFDQSIISGENFSSGIKNFYDVNAGILYSYNDGNNSFYTGFSLYNVRQPEMMFYKDSTSKLNTRKMLHGGGNLYLSSNSESRLMFSFLFMQQNKAIEKNIGAAYGLSFNNSYFYFGAFSRFGDAVYPYFSYQTNSIQLGLTYDITTSYLKNGRNRLNSLELSFIYVKPDQSQERKFMPWNF